jgi:glycosyltransferase involved in cell wall biosynthesis
VSTPAVSVVMTVYNGEPWLGEAVDSILDQTFEDFELIVVDDGSSDGTPKTLSRRAGSRLKVIRQHQTGQTPALNRALGQTLAPLIARMDADDVALPERLGRQVAFLGAHPSVGLLGTGCHEISPEGAILSTHVPPVDDRTIRRALIRKNPFIHSAVMFRRAVLDAAGLYDEGFVVAQDYDLWLRMSRVTLLANLPDPLVLRRMTPGQLSSARDTTRIRDEVVAKLRALRRGTYPPWCAMYLGKPLCALALPPTLRRVLRRAASHREAPMGNGRPA